MSDKKQQILVFEERLNWREEIKKAWEKVKYLVSVKVGRYKRGRVVGIEKERSVVLIHKEKTRDYQSYEGRLCRKWGKSGPVKVYERKGVKAGREVSFEVFTGKPVGEIGSLRVKGRMIFGSGYGNKEGEEYSFKCGFDRDFARNVDKEDWWVELLVEIPDQLVSKEGNLTVYVDDVEVKDKSGKKNDKKVFLTRACFKKKGQKPPLLLVLSVDAVTASDLRGRTELKGFNKMAENSIVFKKAVCSASVTGSASACLMTGLGLTRHMIYDYDTWHYSDKLMTLSPRIKTVAELASGDGYKSLGLTFFSKWRPQYGHARGFHRYINVCSGRIRKYPSLKTATQFIANARREPTYVHLHLPGAHPPYASIRGTKDKNNAAFSGYWETLKQLDLFLETLLTWLEGESYFPQSHIVLLADHGRSVPPYTRYSYQFYEDRLRVPMMFKTSEGWEGAGRWQEKAGKFISATSSVYGLLAEVAGWELPGYYEAVSERFYGGVYWINETVDYKTLGSVGVAGYDDHYKWIVFFGFKNGVINSDNVKRVEAYRLSEEGWADDSEEVSKKIPEMEREQAVKGAKDYVKEGTVFSAGYSSVDQGRIRIDI